MSVAVSVRLAKLPPVTRVPRVYGLCVARKDRSTARYPFAGERAVRLLDSDASNLQIDWNPVYYPPALHDSTKFELKFESLWTRQGSIDDESTSTVIHHYPLRRLPAPAPVLLAEMVPHCRGRNPDRLHRRPQLLFAHAQFLGPVTQLMGLVHVDTRAVLRASLIKSSDILGRLRPA